MEEDLRTLLLATSAITSICSTNINFGEHPQGTSTPYIVMYVIDDAEGTYLDDGPDGGPDGMSQGRVQIDCYARTYGEAKRLARAVRATVDGYKGGSFAAIFVDATRDFREGGTNEADRPFRVSVDILTHWSE